MQKLAGDNLIEAYSLPAGEISGLLREIGAGRPRLITRIGLGAFPEPRKEGGCNAATNDKLVDQLQWPPIKRRTGPG